MAKLMLANISVTENILSDEKYKYLFSVEAVNELVNNGMTFREAYKKVGNDIEQNNFYYQPGQLKYTHEGSIGNLGTEEIQRSFEEVIRKFGF
jgi:argininosuccinate lyase